MQRIARSEALSAPLLLLLPEVTGERLNNTIPSPACYSTSVTRP